jgi:hypothetical protein
MEFWNHLIKQLLTSDEVDLLIYQSRECDIHRGQRLKLLKHHTYEHVQVRIISF